MLMENSVEPLVAGLTRNRVYVKLSNGVKDLRERGYGEVKKDRLLFTPNEAVYLVEKERIKIVNRRIQVSLKDLVKILVSDKKESWIKYLIYRDLRDRGYIVRDSSKFDFEVYGKGALRRLVSIIHEGRDTSLERLEALLAHSKREKKELILAVIDRRTDIVYYTLNSLVIS